MHNVPSMRAKFEALGPYLDERRRRLWAAAEAMVLGRGGITAVANATGLQRTRRRTQAADQRGSQSGPGPGGLGGAGHAGRPDGAAALDVQEHPPVGGRAG